MKRSDLFTLRPGLRFHAKHWFPRVALTRINEDMPEQLRHSDFQLGRCYARASSLSMLETAESISTKVLLNHRRELSVVAQDHPRLDAALHA